MGHRKTKIGAIILVLILAPIISISGVDNVHPGDGNVLAWEPVAGALGYFVYYGQNLNAMNFKVDAGNKTWIRIESIPNINPDYPWFFSVSAYSFNEESQRSTPVFWGENGRRYTIGWSRNLSEDICGYRVYMANRNGIYEGGHPDCDTQDLSCETPVLIGGETYKFKVVAYDCAGNVSSEKEIIKQIPGTPSNKTADTTPPGPVDIISIQ